jgi:CBS domain-containing protein
MIKKEIIEFLQKTPPFDMLAQELLEHTARFMSIEYYPRGQNVLHQDGEPCTDLRIIKKGGVKVYITDNEGDEVVIDYRSEGDSFGYISMISGDRSRANVFTVADTICYLLPKEALMHLETKSPVLGEYFMKSFFLNFIDKTYKEMRHRSLAFGEGDKLLFTTLVKDLISKPPVTADASITIQQAAGMMSQHKITSLILVDKHAVPEGIITNRDLRDKVVAKGLDLSSPVTAIMSPALIRVDSHETCFEALVKMIQFNIHHLIVIEEGKLIGIITNHDFMLLQGTSPLSIVKYIESQKYVEGLLSVHEKINQIIALLFQEGVNATYIIRIITELHDRLIKKIIELSFKEVGEAPGPFAFVLYGSEGRKEQTFMTDFDCAIIYDEQTTPAAKEDMEAFSRRLLSHLQDTFSKSGLPLFNEHPLGGDYPLYGEMSSWEHTIVDAVTAGPEERALHARKLLDLRFVYGENSLAQSLKERIFRRLRNDRRFIGLYLDLALNESSPLGFFKQFVVERSGEHRDKINLKEKGTLPIVDAVRILSVARDIKETATTERIHALAKKDDILSGLADDISSAFEFLLHLRLQDQMRKKEFRQEIDNFIEPEKLTLLEKKTLKEVFQIIPRLQTAVDDYYNRKEAVAL